MAIVNAAHTTVEGVIESQNKTGVKVDGAWLNLSRFRPLELPASGARIRAEVDARGYLCSLEVLDGLAITSPMPPVTQGARDYLGPETPSRDATITKLAVLKAAAEFVGLWGQTREDVRSDHVLVLADKWLAWVTDER